MKRLFILCFTPAVVLALVAGCASTSPQPHILGVWQGPAGRSMEITRHKWIATAGTGHATITYRVKRTAGNKMDVALVDDATGYKGTATLMVEGAILKVTDNEGKWVTWTR